MKNSNHPNIDRCLVTWLSAFGSILTFLNGEDDVEYFKKELSRQIYERIDSKRKTSWGLKTKPEEVKPTDRRLPAEHCERLSIMTASGRPERMYLDRDNRRK